MAQSKHAGCLLDRRNHVLSKKEKNVKIEVSAAFSGEQQREQLMFPETEGKSFLILLGFDLLQVIFPLKMSLLYAAVHSRVIKIYEIYFTYRITEKSSKKLPH